VIGPAVLYRSRKRNSASRLNGAGETLYFIKPDNSRILDAVQFGAQANGVSYGRWPDGANDFYAFTTNTPGTNTARFWIGDIVINELMYDPISGNDNDQYIELYNNGNQRINLAGWQVHVGRHFHVSGQRGLSVPTAMWWWAGTPPICLPIIPISNSGQH